MKFTKMHGIGNDYIYVNCINQTLDNPSKYAKMWSDRHFGIGSDGLVLILPSSNADFKMDIYNSDGSRAEMCGNAARCIGKYVYENNLTSKKEVFLETLSGIKKLQLFVENDIVETVRVDMGIPVFEAHKIPINTNLDAIINYPLIVDGNDYNITCVSIGNPHAVIFIEDNLDSLNIKKIGSDIENRNLFPNKTNVEFVTVVDENNIKMRVWERGVGETLACGTGACAALAATVINGYCKRRVKAHLKGGSLIVELNNFNHIFITGSATKVFDGEI